MTSPLPKRRAGIRWSAVLAAVMVLAAGGRATAADRVHLTYTIYLGYFSAIDVNATVALTDDRYRVEAEVAPESWIAWAVPWTSRSFAEGRIESGVPRPEHARTERAWGARSHHTEIDFDGKDGVQVQSDSPVSDENREAVPENLIVGALDPASVVTMMSQAARGAEGCAPVMPVFDGRRRFDIRGERQPDATMPPSRYTAYAGPVTACRLTFVTVAGGYRDGERSRFWQTAGSGQPRPPVTVWLASLRPDQPPLPVYAMADTLIGTITVYLSAFRFEPAP